MLLSAPPLEHTPPWPGAAAEGAVDDVHRQVRGTGCSARTAAPPRSGPVESQRLPDEAGVDDLEAGRRGRRRRRRRRRRPAAPVELPSAKVMFCTVSCGVCLVLAVRRGPALGLVAGVHVQDPARAAAAERDLAAAVEHDARGGVADLRGGGHRDHDRRRAAGEGDHPAGGDRRDHGRRGAARRRAVADDGVGCEVSTGWPAAGIGAWPSGLPKDAGGAAAVLVEGDGDDAAEEDGASAQRWTCRARR